MRCHSNFIVLLVFLLNGIFISIKAQDSIPMQTLDELVFVAKRIYEPSALTITNRDFKRLAASFDDPSRILMHYPGFSNANDQANGIIYHGLPSHLSGWQLNGLDIVNPNHLSNAGTFSDRSSFSAGGVNMFSGNLINRYQYNTSLSSDMKGAALAGISNIIIDSLDKSYVQASLLGLEVGYQKKTGKHSLFGSYRYSFTGLLGNLGVNFGNEKIAFSDAMIGYKYDGKKSKLTLIGATGKSSNFHEANREAVELIKDYFNIDYKAEINIFQMKYELVYGADSKLDLGFSYSDKKDKRDALGYVRTTTADSFEIITKDNNYNYKIVFNQELKLKNWFRFGAKEIYNEIDYVPFHLIAAYNSINGKRWAIMPYLQKEFNFSGFEALLNFSSIFDDGFYYTPSLKIKYRIKRHIINALGGLSAQLLNPYDAKEQYSTGTNYDISYQYDNNGFTAQLGWFIHTIKNLPAGHNFYSTINQFDALHLDDLKNNSTANSNGYYIYINKEFNNGLWLNTNATIFDLQYRGSNFDWQNAESNFGSIYNINIGKKVRVKTNQLNFSTSFHYRGGAYQYQPIDKILPTLDYTLPPSLRLNDYSRLDVRINYIKGKSFWSLDIQNVFNTLNDAYQYYDFELRTQKQLGMIPVLTYKYSF